MGESLDAIAQCCPSLADGALRADEAVELAGLFKALSDPVRLRLLSLVAAVPDGEVCACDLVEPVGRSQPTVSHHMAALVDAGLVFREQRGRWAWYRVNPSRLEAARAALG